MNLKDAHIPTSIEIAKSEGGILLLLVALYFIIGFLILYMFFKPVTPEGVMAVAGLSILWNIY